MNEIKQNNQKSDSVESAPSASWECIDSTVDFAPSTVSKAHRRQNWLLGDSVESAPSDSVENRQYLYIYPDPPDFFNFK